MQRVMQAKAGLQQFVEQRWYGRPGVLLALAPLEAIFRQLASRRRHTLQSRQIQLPVPVVVVGNLSVGGTGKTPVVKALINHFRRAGYTPGVVSRGYGRVTQGLQLVTAGSPASAVGDEPLEIHSACQVPVVVGENRVEAAKLLLDSYPCDLIISDDGLQHYALPRDLEIAVVDADMGLGNGHCLPVGPLREPPTRLSEVDVVLIAGGHFRARIPLPPCRQYTYQLHTEALVNLVTGESRPLTDLAAWPPFIAVAGIGKPDKFFHTLGQLLPTDRSGFERWVFPDHYGYSIADFSKAPDDTAIVMTEKDAAKCRDFARDNWWFIRVRASFDNPFIETLFNVLQQKQVSA